MKKVLCFIYSFLKHNKKIENKKQHIQYIKPNIIFSKKSDIEKDFNS